MIFNKNKENSMDLFLTKCLKLIFNVTDFVSGLYNNSFPEAYSYFYNQASTKETSSTPSEKEIIEISNLSNYIDKPLQLAVYNHPRLIREALWFKERAAAFKIKLEIITYSFNDNFFTEKIMFDADMALATDIPVTDIELGYFDFLLNKTLLFQKFVDKRQLSIIHSLTEKYRSSIFPEQKAYLINEIENYITQENILIYLYHPLKHYNIHSFINGVEFDSNGNIVLNKLWW
ncbi:ABC transporter substrate-binding protein [Listeria ivanovii]|uniref:ABC transporter substrate-binding protein n=1 Tax=Listeria ivanovii TaxID=1638 RepID=UPI0021ABA933|nr:ABC transporter substrate-binding protein [Listeria ivanovii]